MCVHINQLALSPERPGSGNCPMEMPGTRVLVSLLKESGMLGENSFFQSSDRESESLVPGTSCSAITKEVLKEKHLSKGNKSQCVESLTG